MQVPTSRRSWLSATGCQMFFLSSFLLLASASAGFCPGVFNTTPALATLDVPGQPEMVVIGSRFSEVSLLAAAISSIALADGIGYPTKMVASHHQAPGLDPFANTAVIYPGDMRGTAGMSGLKPDDLLMAVGLTPTASSLGYNIMGTVGIDFRLGLYAPSYTVAKLAQYYNGTLFTVPKVLGVPTTTAGRAVYALLRGKTDIVGGEVMTLNISLSIACRMLCVSGPDPLVSTVLQQLGLPATMAPIRPSMLRGMRRFTRTFVPDASENPDPVAEDTLTCSGRYQHPAELERAVETRLALGRDFLVLGWTPWTSPVASQLTRLPLPEYDALSLMGEYRYSDFPSVAGVPITAHEDFIVR